MNIVIIIIIIIIISMLCFFQTLPCTRTYTCRTCIFTYTTSKQQW
jgi:hypothetical protein